jgi:simple sugar transport system ATP-binding protein
MDGTNILEMKDIWKIYPNGVVANKSMNLSVTKGEIHALLGENGAGKSTLMKILFGIEQPTKGKIVYEGKEVEISSPDKAIELGIGMVHQHFMLVPSLTVAENIILGMEPRKGLSINMEEAYRFVKEKSEEFGLPVPSTEKVKDISVGMKQRVEIIKTLVRGANLIILDEPTAVLTPQETVDLFKALKTLTDSGKTIIFITHRGKIVGKAEVKDITEIEMSRMMVGRDVDIRIDKEPANTGEILLEVKNANYTRNDGVQAVKNISFNLKKGEILGIAGVEGNGQTELIRMITGISKKDSGEITIDGRTIPENVTPAFCRKAGLSHIPADRMHRGIAPDSSIEDNIISDRFNQPPFANTNILNRKAIRSFGEKMVEEFDIRADNSQTKVKMLSGGNIQKVVVAREFTAKSKITVADQPTRGIDIAAADFIRRRLVSERDNGLAVLLISADLTELLEVADRIVVLYKGEIVAHFKDVKAVNENILGEYMLGIKKMSQEEMGDLV